MRRGPVTLPHAPMADAELARRIADFASSASAEVTPNDEGLIPELATKLRPGTVVYVAHPPKATLEDVVQTSRKTQAAGLAACPHIVARRIESRKALQDACARLGEAGVARALVVAGDNAQPAGDFVSALDVLRTDVLATHGMNRIGVAGHPEGHRAIGQTVLWRALLEKQTLAERRGIEMHVVTQFGFDPAAVASWDACLSEHGIRLPVRVGMAGPASLPQLIGYAMQCGVGASLRGALRSMNAMRNVAGLAISPDQMLTSVARYAATGATHIAGVHFYSFGGALATARWLQAVGDGRFELNADADAFATTG
jgi:methylenetetrahydrofolate reductase (NADPH)